MTTTISCATSAPSLVWIPGQGRRQPGQTVFNQLRQGILLEDGLTLPAEVAVIDRKRDASWLRVILREGRKRQAMAHV